ncbi:phoenix [Scleropages formosus]|uniref:phoenix n=1 Tax=Scleropages formosus TaxID=113540 RepID=UPI0010FA7216|nr:uncharacterized protein LOC108936027 [Scleropages formosus]
MQQEDDIIQDTPVDEGQLIPYTCHSLTKCNSATASLWDYQSCSQPLTLSPEAQPDSASEDSLFQTQHETLPVRTVGRWQPPKRCLHPTENEWSHSLDTAWTQLGAVKLKRKYQLNPEKSKKLKWKGPAFPFIEKFYKRKHLTRKKSLTWEYGAVAGYFLYMEKVKRKSVSAGLQSVPVLLKERYVDDKEDLIPLPEPTQAEQLHIEDHNNTEVVDHQYFIPQFKGKLKARSTWCTRSSSDCSDHSELDLISDYGQKSRHSKNVQSRYRTKKTYKLHKDTCIMDDVNTGITHVEEHRYFDHRDADSAEQIRDTESRSTTSHSKCMYKVRKRMLSDPLPDSPSVEILDDTEVLALTMGELSSVAREQTKQGSSATYCAAESIENKISNADRVEICHKEGDLAVTEYETPHRGLALARTDVIRSKRKEQNMEKDLKERILENKEEKAKRKKRQKEAVIEKQIDSENNVTSLVFSNGGGKKLKTNKERYSIKVCKSETEGLKKKIPDIVEILLSEKNHMGGECFSAQSMAVIQSQVMQNEPKGKNQDLWKKSKHKDCHKRKTNMISDNACMAENEMSALLNNKRSGETEVIIDLQDTVVLKEKNTEMLDGATGEEGIAMAGMILCEQTDINQEVAEDVFQSEESQAEIKCRKRKKTEKNRKKKQMKGLTEGDAVSLKQEVPMLLNEELEKDDEEMEAVNWEASMTDVRGTNRHVSEPPFPFSSHNQNEKDKNICTTFKSQVSTTSSCLLESTDIAVPGVADYDMRAKKRKKDKKDRKQKGNEHSCIPISSVIFPDVNPADSGYIKRREQIEMSGEMTLSQCSEVVPWKQRNKKHIVDDAAQTGTNELYVSAGHYSREPLPAWEIEGNEQACLSVEGTHVRHRFDVESSVNSIQDEDKEHNHSKKRQENKMVLDVRSNGVSNEEDVSFLEPQMTLYSVVASCDLQRVELSGDETGKAQSKKRKVSVDPCPLSEETVIKESPRMGSSCNFYSETNLQKLIPGSFPMQEDTEVQCGRNEASCSSTEESGFGACISTVKQSIPKQKLLSLRARRFKKWQLADSSSLHARYRNYILMKKRRPKSDCST